MTGLSPNIGPFGLYKEQTMYIHFKYPPIIAIASLSLVIASGQILAAPNGNPTLPGGTTQFFIAEFPPITGNYLQIISSYSKADQFNDQNGDKKYDQDLKVAAQTLRLTTTWDKKILGSDITISEIIGTYVDLNNQIHTPYGDVKLNDDGLADVLFEPLILQWNKGQQKQWQMVAGLGFVLPIGTYSKSHDVNVAGHYFSIAPRVALKYKFENGLEAAISPMVNFNWKNSDSNYKTGNELTIDYLLAYHSNNWRFGATGYYYTQLENDELDGQEIKDSKTKSFSIGPAIQYQFMNGKGPLVSASWIKDVESENKAEGQTFWLSAAI